MERMEALTGYYTTHNEEARFSTKHGQVEFLTTIRYVEKYLADGMKILEIGAGTGRYSHYFARRGYCVDAVELMECNVEAFRALTEEGESVTVRQGDALDLGYIPDGTYDVTLLLGPMYHLYTEEEQKKALREAVRVTKPGGVLFVAYCNNDMTVYQFGFVRGHFRGGEEYELVNYDTFKLSSPPSEVFVLLRREDVDALIADLPVTRLHYVGTDMLTHFIRDAVDGMDDATFDLYMKYHFCICERPDTTGLSNHMLDILRVKE